MDQQNHRENIGSGGGGKAGNAPLPSVLAEAGITGTEWNTFISNVVVPFYRQNHGLPASMSELKELVGSTSGRG